MHLKLMHFLSLIIEDHSYLRVLIGSYSPAMALTSRSDVVSPTPYQCPPRTRCPRVWVRSRGRGGTNLWQVARLLSARAGFAAERRLLVAVGGPRVLSPRSRSLTCLSPLRSTPRRWSLEVARRGPRARARLFAGRHSAVDSCGQNGFARLTCDLKVCVSSNPTRSSVWTFVGEGWPPPRAPAGPDQPPSCSWPGRQLAARAHRCAGPSRCWGDPRTPPSTPREAASLHTGQEAPRSRFQRGSSPRRTGKPARGPHAEGLVLEGLAAASCPRCAADHITFLLEARGPLLSPQ